MNFLIGLVAIIVAFACLHLFGWTVKKIFKFSGIPSIPLGMCIFAVGFAVYLMCDGLGEAIRSLLK